MTLFPAVFSRLRDEDVRFVVLKSIDISPFAVTFVMEIELSFVERERSSFIVTFSILTAPSLGEIGLLMLILEAEVSVIEISQKMVLEIEISVFPPFFPILFRVRTPFRLTLLEAIESFDKYGKDERDREERKEFSIFREVRFFSDEELSQERRFSSFFEYIDTLVSNDTLSIATEERDEGSMREEMVSRSKLPRVV